MPEVETELPLLEPGKPASAATEEILAEAAQPPGGDPPAPAATKEILAEPAPPSDEAPASSAEPVSRADYDLLKAERDQLLDRLARLQAEFENARKRAERERIEFREYATGSVAEQFLPVLDNFALALNSAGSVEQLRSGVELIVKQMEEILRRLQVIPVAAVGEAFDPRLHEAIGTVERDDLPDQHVAEEIRRGYRLRERLLRPAVVRVASNPKQKSE
ncbi:MAG: nucleotide exchange factor GrpE [Terracidiphilus sp.]|jgi:molecular chaperone GrpE